MKYSQRHFFNSVQLELGDEEFQYTITSGGAKKRFSVDYMEFDSTPAEESEEANTWWRNVGIAWLAIGGVMTWLRYAKDSSDFRISVWLFLGLVFLAVYYFGRTSFTHHATGEGGRVLLIKNRSAAAILQELASRRKTRLRETFGEVDPAADPETEIAKFRWLQNEGAIGSAEASARIQQIVAAREEKLGKSAPEVN